MDKTVFAIGTFVFLILDYALKVRSENSEYGDYVLLTSLRSGRPGKVQILSLETETVTDLKPVGQLGEPRGLAYHHQSGDVYIADTYLRRISKFTLDQGSTLESVHQFANEQPSGIAIDETRGKLYIVTNGAIYRCNLDATDLELFFVLQYGARAVAMDQKNGYVYWSGETSVGEWCIWRVSRDISSRDVDAAAVVNATKVESIHGLYIDASGNRIIWTTAEPNTIQTAKLDGSSPSTFDISSRDWKLAGVTVVGSDIYIAGETYKKRSILRLEAAAGWEKPYYHLREVASTNYFTPFALVGSGSVTGGTSVLFQKTNMGIATPYGQNAVLEASVILKKPFFTSSG